MGAMTVVVADARTVVHEVPTVDVILESVGIVISAFCTFILKLVCPDIGCKVWVCDVNTSIEDGDDRTLGRYLRCVPQVIDIYTSDAPVTVVVIEWVFLVEVAIASGGGINEVVWLGKLYVVYCLQFVNNGVHILLFCFVEADGIEC